MRAFRSRLWFVALNIAMWLLMVAILVVVPDTLERWLSLELARVTGWGVAGAVWALAIEAEWRKRTGPIVRFFVQTILWVTAAFVAIWISDRANIR